MLQAYRVSFSFFFSLLQSTRTQSIRVRRKKGVYAPARSLLVQHTVAAVAAADRLAALQRNIHVAVAALVVHCARCCVDGCGCVVACAGLRGVVAAAVLLGHGDLPWEVCVKVVGGSLGVSEKA